MREKKTENEPKSRHFFPFLMKWQEIHLRKLSRTNNSVKYLWNISVSTFFLSKESRLDKQVK